MTVSPIPNFLAAFGGGPDHLSPFLADDVVFQAADLPAVEGRAALLRLWGRLFQSYRRIEMRLVRHVPDGDLVLAEQRQTFTPRDRPAVQVQSIVVYTLRDGRIATWSDHLVLEELPEAEAALWRRLWAARW